MIVFMLVVEDVKNEYELVVNVGVLLLMLLMMMFRVVVLVSFLLDIVIVQDSDVVFLVLMLQFVFNVISFVVGFIVSLG